MHLKEENYKQIRIQIYVLYIDEQYKFHNAHFKSTSSQILDNQIDLIILHTMCISQQELFVFSKLKFLLDWCFFEKLYQIVMENWKYKMTKTANQILFFD